MTALYTDRITKRYAEHLALDEVSVKVQQGTICGLLGPNGAGKTTLIRIINQIIQPDSGRIELFGESLRPHHVSLIGYLPEERGLYKKLRVGEQLLYIAQLRGMSKADAMQRIRYWFERMELKDWWGKRIEDLSKGMAQKIQFISTILHEPKLLILDEPFSGFDPLNAKLITDIILELKKSGVTILFSTHRMETVESLCDDVVLINRAQKILDGTRFQIQDQFRTHTAEIEHRQPINLQQPGRYELLESAAIEGGKIRSRVRILDGSHQNELLRLLIDQTEVVSFREQIPSMGEIFIQLVNGSSHRPKH